MASFYAENPVNHVPASPPGMRIYAVDFSILIKNIEPTPSNASAKTDIFAHINVPPTSSPGKILTSLRNCAKLTTFPVESTNTVVNPARVMASVAVGTATTRHTAVGVQTLEGGPSGCPDHKDLTQVEGVVFPEHAEAVNWADGHRTYLPWISDEKDPTRNKIEKVCPLSCRYPAVLTVLQEATHVRHIAQTARPSTESPYIAHIEYKDYPTELKLTQRIDEEISKGNSVILRGYPHHRTVGLDKESIEDAFSIPPDHEFDVLGKQQNLHPTVFYTKRSIDAHKRYTEKSPHIRTSLEEFCKGFNDPSKIQCILDCATVDGWCPSFVK
jgi:hypothetical protein